MAEDATTLLASFNTTLTAALGGASEYTKCLCAHVAACCWLYSRVWNH